jgi:dihydropyrimidinase
MYDLAIINGDVYFDGKFHKTNVFVRDGKISRISPILLHAEEIYDAKDMYVMPGIIDPHVHFKLDLGDTSSRDDFYSGSKCAAFGGVTTFIDFLRPVSTAQELKKSYQERKKEASKSVIDYAFHACVANPVNEVDKIVDTMNDLNIKTVKLFTTYSESNRRTFKNEIKQLLKRSITDRIMVLAHLENDELIDHNPLYTYHDLPKSRPTISETYEALEIAKILKKTGGKLYMVHLSSGTTLKRLKQEAKDILHKNLFIESCPHYFTFSNQKLKARDGYLYTMAPPLRSELEVKELHALFDDVDTIGTDHCSFYRKDKRETYLSEIPLGIGSAEHSFNIMFKWFGIKAIDKMTLNVAKLHGLYPRKGVIQEGSDADVFIYQLKKHKIFKDHSNSDYNPYQDIEVKGEVISTISRGKFVVRNQVFITNKGRLLNEVKS